jgi:hypothetical protein
MQAWKPPVKGETFLAKSEDGKVELSSVVLPSRGGKTKAGIMVRFINIAPGTAYPDRYDVMSNENWDFLLGSFLPSLQNAFSGIVAARENAAKARKERALKHVETIKATGLPAVAAQAAIVATLKSEGYDESEVKQYANVA